MPSFDIVSRVDMAEVDNALAGVMREISTRFDFKGSQSSVKREEGALTVVADDALKLKQMQELLKGHLTRRKVDAGVLDFAEPRRPPATRSARRLSSARASTANSPESSYSPSRMASSRCRPRSKATSSASPARSATISRPPWPASAPSSSSSPCNS